MVGNGAVDAQCNHSLQLLRSAVEEHNLNLAQNHASEKNLDFVDRPAGKVPDTEIRHRPVRKKYALPNIK